MDYQAIASTGQAATNTLNTLYDIGWKISGGQKRDEERQLSYQKELMGLQNIYNIQAMNRQFNQQKEMYEYTGYASKVRQMKEAGLNPALMYGGSGAGGGTVGNSSAIGVGAGTAPNTSASRSNALAVTGMALQTAKLRSEIQVNESIANANNAAAKEKNEGTIPKLQQETENLKKTLELIVAQTGSEQVKKLGIELDNNYKTIQNSIQTATEDAQIKRIAFEAEQAGKNVELTIQAIRKTKGEADVQEQSVESLVKANKERADLLVEEILKTKALTKLTDEQAKAVNQELQLKLGELLTKNTGQEIDLYRIQTEVYKVLLENDAAMKREWVRALSNLVSSGIIRSGLPKQVYMPQK